MTNYLYECRLCGDKFIGDVCDYDALFGLSHMKTEMLFKPHKCNENQVGFGDLIGTVEEASDAGR